MLALCRISVADAVLSGLLVPLLRLAPIRKV